VTQPRRRAISTPGERRDPASRGPGTVAASIVLHVVFVLVLVQLTIGPADWIDSLMRNSPPAPVERVGFLQLPKGEPPKEAPRRGGDNRPLSLAPPSAPLPLPPVNIPSALPPIPSRPLRASAGEVGSGPLVGGGGETRGVRPTYADPRIWAPTSPMVTAPLTATARLDSAMLPVYAALIDSMRKANGGRDPSDWTTTIGGQKYGIDRKYIRLGPLSIPTAMLALLPLNIQGNPTAIEHDRRLAQMRDEIINQAARAARDDDFQKAVKSLRERKQKERDDAKKAEQPPAKIIPQ
jgi:hypothetical protein